jgi:hypothetical protein
VKVIKKGRPQKGWSREAKCTGNNNGGGGCDATLLVEQSDLFSTTSTDMGGDTDYYVTFKCSECGVLTDLEGAAKPPHSIIGLLPTQKAWDRNRGDHSG